MKKLYFIGMAMLIVTVLFSGCAKTEETVMIVDTDVIDKEITLYFPDEQVMYFEKEVREVVVDERNEKTVLLELIKGPQDENLLPSISGNVKVLSVKTENGLCTIDLSSEFAEFNTGGSTKERIAVYSIVNSLCELEGIEKVKINIEGDENHEFGGHFTLEEPFVPGEI